MRFKILEYQRISKYNKNLPHIMILTIMCYLIKYSIYVVGGSAF